jgi:uncharacterized protein YecT (DUF1311 family)
VWHATYSYPGVTTTVNNLLRHAAVATIALFSFTACRGHSPDSGGDVALARDLAEAQLAGSSASAGGRVASDSDSVANSSGENDPLAAQIADPVTVRNPVVRAASARTASSRTVSSRTVSSRTASSRKIPDRVRKPAKQTPADPCASSESEDQHACLSSSTHRSDARLDSIYRMIVKAVRKQQRVAAGAADPPYATTLGRAEKTWTSWRDAECERVTRGKGGEQWAVPRANCLAKLTDERAVELSQILAKAQKH